MIKVLFFMDGIGNAGGIQEMAIKWMENIDRSKVKIDILTYNHVKADNYKDRVKALGGEVYVIESFQDKNKFLLSMKQTASFFEQHSDYNIIHAHASSKNFSLPKSDFFIPCAFNFCTTFISVDIAA